jgi:hypothetical protein
MLWDIGHVTAETEHETCTVWMISGNLLTTSWELEDDADADLEKSSDTGDG